ncbi:MAG: winged helix-turn-helix transcriptional regulator [Candidatus Riflebacteria bacterium]|nr:winged helix-turn-helix transcriptional regulator [Candidatus Riflebacteria bacterium]
MSRTGQVVSRDEIVEHVWGNKPDFNRNLLDVTLCHLRRKVELEGRPRLIHSVRGAGFVLRSADDPPPRKRES